MAFTDRENPAHIRIKSKKCGAHKAVVSGVPKSACGILLKSGGGDPHERPGPPVSEQQLPSTAGELRSMIDEGSNEILPYIEIGQRFASALAPPALRARRVMDLAGL